MCLACFGIGRRLSDTSAGAIRSSATLASRLATVSTRSQQGINPHVSFRGKDLLEYHLTSLLGDRGLENASFRALAEVLNLK